MESDATKLVDVVPDPPQADPEKVNDRNDN